MSASQQTCPSCGTLNRAGAKFCQYCGSRLAEAPIPSGAPSPVELPPSPNRPPLTSSPPSAQARAVPRAPILIAAVVALCLIVVVGAAAVVALNSSRLGLGGANATPTTAAIAVTSTPGSTLTVAPTTTDTPVPSPTNPPTATNTASPTATPLPDAEVSGDALNLRSGPGTVYDVLAVLHKGDRLALLSKTSAGDWLQVRTASGQHGWASASLLKVNKSLSSVPLAAAIPPRPTPAFTPTPKVCPANPALVSVTNELGTGLTVTMTGPQNSRLHLSANQTLNVCIEPGTYAWSGSAAGYNDQTGSRTFDAGAPQCWWFYQIVNLHTECNAPTDPNAYSPP